MIDPEGPNNPPDADGKCYSMTYMCFLCHGILLDKSPKCNASEARRMFARCIFRSGTIPSLLRSDRGPDFKNALMQEYCALLGIGRRFGTPWRPVEQGLVEGVHKETQKFMGKLVKHVFQCLPQETGELFPIVEFIAYNTPGPHGYTPRDIDRRWSLSTPLEKELHGFQVNEFEPLSEYAAALFRNCREIRARVLDWLQTASRKRAALANRHRKDKTIRPGDYVVLRDPRARKAGGRAPYNEPCTDPLEVISVTGNKAVIRRPDGTLITDCHLEALLRVPDHARNMETNAEPPPDSPEIQFDPTENTRRSPGEMLVDGGRALQDQTLSPAKPNKLTKLTYGAYAAYRAATLQGKVAHAGMITNISAAEAMITGRKHYPVSDSRMRLHWAPVFEHEGEESLGSGSKPSLENVAVARIICTF